MMPSGHKIKLNKEKIKNIIYDYIILKLSTRQIANKFGFKCHKSIKNILIKNNITIRNHKESVKLLEKKFTQHEINLIINLYTKPEIGITALGHQFKCDPQTIKKILKKYNIYDPSKFDNFLINKFNIIDSEEKAYWLGFLAADGSISKKQLSLSLSEKDINHLLKFKKFIEVDYNITKTITTLKNKKFIGYKYSISSTNFIKSLIKHNLYPNKSSTITIPNTIPNHLLHHYIRGLFDGDGSIFANKKTNKTTFSIISSYDMCKQIQKLLINNCNVKENKLYNIKENKNIKIYAYLAYTGNKQNKRIYNYMYQDATIYLERKKEIFIKYLFN